MGGAVFVFYYAHIGYMPDFDLSSSLVMLAAAAFTAVSIFVLMVLLMIFPGYAWNQMWVVGSRMGKEWARRGSFFGLVGWFFVPVFSFYAILVLAATRSYLFLSALFVVFATYFCYIRFFRSSEFRDAQKEFFLFSFASLMVSVLLLFPFLVVYGIYSDSEKIFGSYSWMALVGGVVFVLYTTVFVVHLSSVKNGFFWIAGFGVVTVLALLMYFGKTHAIPASVMRLYGFGDVHVSKIVMSGEACDVISKYCVKVDPVGERLCSVNDVVILSRLGDRTYIKSDHLAKPSDLDSDFVNCQADSVEFAIKSSAIISWGKIKEGDSASN